MKYYFSIESFIVNTPLLRLRLEHRLNDAASIYSGIPSQMHPSPITLVVSYFNYYIICTFNRNKVLDNSL